MSRGPKSNALRSYQLWGVGPENARAPGRVATPLPQYPAAFPFSRVSAAPW